MKIVAEKLDENAVSEADDAAKALYVRSAFNRFYYHCHFRIRNEVRSLMKIEEFPHGSKMGSPMHNGYKKRIRDKLPLLGNKDAEDKISLHLDVLVKTILSSVTLLYNARQIADYDDKAKIVISGTQHTILDENGKSPFSIEDARHNVSSIDDCLEQIRAIKEQIGLI